MHTEEKLETIILKNIKEHKGEIYPEVLFNRVIGEAYELEKVAIPLEMYQSAFRNLQKNNLQITYNNVSLR